MSYVVCHLTSHWWSWYMMSTSVLLLLDAWVTCCLRRWDIHSALGSGHWLDALQKQVHSTQILSLDTLVGSNMLTLWWLPRNWPSALLHIQHHFVYSGTWAAQETADLIPILFRLVGLVHCHNCPKLGTTSQFLLKVAFEACC